MSVSLHISQPEQQKAQGLNKSLRPNELFGSMDWDILFGFTTNPDRKKYQYYTHVRDVLIPELANEILLFFPNLRVSLMTWGSANDIVQKYSRVAPQGSIETKKTCYNLVFPLSPFSSTLLERISKTPINASEPSESLGLLALVKSFTAKEIGWSLLNNSKVTRIVILFTNYHFFDPWRHEDKIGDIFLDWPDVSKVQEDRECAYARPEMLKVEGLAQANKVRVLLAEPTDDLVSLSSSSLIIRSSNIYSTQISFKNTENRAKVLFTELLTMIKSNRKVFTVDDANKTVPLIKITTPSKTVEISSTNANDGIRNVSLRNITQANSTVPVSTTNSLPDKERSWSKEVFDSSTSRNFKFDFALITAAGCGSMIMIGLISGIIKFIESRRLEKEEEIESDVFLDQSDDVKKTAEIPILSLASC